MRAAWHLAISSLAGRRLRTTLLVVAIAVAASLSVAVGAMTGTLSASFELAVGRMTGLADLRIRHRAGERLDQKLLDSVRAWPETRLAGGRLMVASTAYPAHDSDSTSSPTAQAPDANHTDSDPGPAADARASDDQDPTHDDESPARSKLGIIAVGVDPTTNERLQPTPLLEGRAVEAAGEVAIDQSVAEELNLTLGDRCEIRPEKQPDLLSGVADQMLGRSASTYDAQEAGAAVTLRVVGIYRRTPLRILQRPTLLMAQSDARELSGAGTRFDSILVKLIDGADPESVAESRADQVGGGVVLRTTAATNENVRRGMMATRLMVLMVAAMVLMAAGFIVATSLTTSVTEQVRELGLWRCVGAERAQIALGQILVGGLIAIAGAALGGPIGITLGYGLFHRHREILVAGFSPDWIAITAAIALTLLTGLLGAAYPAWRGARSEPMQAVAVRARKASRAGLILCLLLGLGCAAFQPLILALPIPPETAFWLYASLGLPLLFVGFFLLSVPLIVLLTLTLGPILTVLLRLPARPLIKGVLARPFRFGFTAGAFMVGAAMLISIWIGGRSVLEGYFGRITMPDAYVHSFFSLPPQTVEAIRRVEGVHLVCPTTMFPVQLKQARFGLEKLSPRNTMFFSFEPDAFFQMTELEWVEGDPERATERLERGRAILVSKEYRLAHGLGIGDTLTINTPEAGDVEFEIAGVVASPGLDVAVQVYGIQDYYADASVSSVFGTRADTRRFFGHDSTNLVLIRFTPEADEQTTLASIRQTLPGMTVVQSSANVKRMIEGIGGRLMAVFSGVAFFTILIASFGAGNIMLANFAARRFEFGVWRAMGAAAGYAARLLACEAIIVGLTAWVAGAALGYQLAAIGRVFHMRLVGLSYDIQIPWDVQFIALGVMVGFAMLAALPVMLRVLTVSSRSLLASRLAE